MGIHISKVYVLSYAYILMSYTNEEYTPVKAHAFSVGTKSINLFIM